ncbi:MAG: thiamine phosphate synthase [Acidobacteria bacterium]|nr:MAG: thiamine phosphate synthase [Acidobacteriota bacterium]
MISAVRLQLPRIYPITNTAVSGLTHTEQVAHLLRGGATFIQLREKTNSPRAFFDDAESAVHLARAAGAAIIINDRVDLALALGASGVHLGQTDMPVNAARQLLGPDAIIGYSTHNLDQVVEALELPINYLAFGPIFPTRTKENPDPIAGVDGLRAAKTLAGELPVVAIGGIDESNMADIFTAGADSAAIISGILSNAQNIAANLRKMMRAGSQQPR